MTSTCGVSAFGCFALSVAAPGVEGLIYSPNEWREGEEPLGQLDYFFFQRGRFSQFAHAAVEQHFVWLYTDRGWQGRRQSPCHWLYIKKKKEQVSKDQVHVHIPSKHLEKVFPQGTSAVLDAVIDQHVSMSEGFINKESHISQTKWLFIVLALKKYILANSPTVKGTTCLYDSGLAGWKLPAGIDLSALWNPSHLSLNFARDAERSAPSLNRFRYVAGGWQTGWLAPGHIGLFFHIFSGLTQWKGGWLQIVFMHRKSSVLFEEFESEINK